MFRRPSLRSTVTTLAAAAVLVGGADLASYAATGKPLVLGHANTAGGTTSLTNTGRGPALSLSSAKDVAPLVVDSGHLVRHLNADTVHGVPAAVVAPKDYQVIFARAGGNFAPARFVTFSVPPGAYQITLQGEVVPSTATPVQCFTGDKSYLTTQDPTDIQAADFDPGTQFGVTLNAVGTATIRPGHQEFIGCVGDSTSNHVVLPIVANLTRVNGVVRRRTTVVPPGAHPGTLLGR